jgi:hypothetical protein
MPLRLYRAAGPTIRVAAILSGPRFDAKAQAVKVRPKAEESRRYSVPPTYTTIPYVCTLARCSRTSVCA